MSEKIYYKVVRNVNGTLKSCRASRWGEWGRKEGDIYSVDYKVLDWTYPNLSNSLLFVFTDLETARGFCNDKSCLDGDPIDEEIWECEVGEVFDIKPVNDGLKDYWKDIEENNSDSLVWYSYCDVKNTVSAKAVKLLKKV